MTTKDIKSPTWITYQGADNSVWARMVNPHIWPHDGAKQPYEERDAYFEREHKYSEFETVAEANTFPILNTTEIGLEIQGEDLDLIWQYKPKDEQQWYVASCSEASICEEYNKRQALRYTPKQTPKADSEKIINELGKMIAEVKIR
jgi:hypothetical protein